jgi:hypothetical protein
MGNMISFWGIAGNVFHIGYVKEIGIFKPRNTPKQSATYIERSLRFDYL